MQGGASLALGHILARLRRYGSCYGIASVFLEGSMRGNDELGVRIQGKNTVNPGFPPSSFVTRGREYGCCGGVHLRRPSWALYPGAYFGRLKPVKARILSYALAGFGDRRFFGGRGGGVRGAVDVAAGGTSGVGEQGRDCDGGELGAVDVPGTAGWVCGV